MTTPLREPRIVCFLQNQWFKDPDRAAKLLEKYEQREENGKGRERFIRDFLFFGCLTGRRIDKVFGEDFRHKVVWEEVSKEISGPPNHVPTANLNHVAEVIAKYQPDVVIALGKIASDAIFDNHLSKICSFFFIPGLHPAARKGAEASLREVKSHLSYFLSCKKDLLDLDL